MDQDRAAQVIERVDRAWTKARGSARWPKRADLRPEEIGRALPHVALIDVVREDQLDFRYRIVGEHLISGWGRNLKGRLHSELLGGADDARDVLKALAAVVERGAPELFCTSFRNDRGLATRLNGCLYPLSDDGDAVTGVLGCGVFTYWAV